MEQVPLKTLRLDFTVLEFFESFVVSSIFDEVVLDEKQVEELSQNCLDFYGNSKFVYISNRKSRYNVIPTIYLNVNKFDFLAGIAVVSDNLECLNTANFERQFSRLPFEVFLEMEDAREWALELVRK